MKRFLLTACLLALLPGISSPAEEAGSAVTAYEEIWKKAVAKGKLYLEGKLYDDAIAYFSNLKRMYPDAPFLHYYLGLAYYLKDDLENAEKNLKKTIEIDLYGARAYYYLALIEHKKGNDKKVVEYLDEVTLLDETFQGAYYNKGVTFLSLGEPERAAKEFAYALHLSPIDYLSFAGFLQAYAGMDLIVLDERAIQNVNEVKIIVKTPPIEALHGAPAGSVVTEAKRKKKDKNIKYTTWASPTDHPQLFLFKQN